MRVKAAWTTLAVAAVAAPAAKGFTSDVAHVGIAGMPVEGSFLAVVKGSEASCQIVRNKIEEERRLANGGGLIAFGQPTSSVQILQTCVVAFKGDEKLAAKVEEIPEVLYVEQDTMFEAQAENWGLNRIDQATLPLSTNVPFAPLETGKGVNIYILDTGINKDHEEFGGRAQFGPDYIREDTLEDANGHGTHCAGIAAGTSYGVAKEATVIGVKVLSQFGSGSAEKIIDGIARVVKIQNANQPGKAAVLSLSLGGAHQQALNDAIVAAAEANMIVVVAAGNNNDDACNYSPASTGGNARAMGPITVAATDMDDQRSSFSNFGYCVDIFAPGRDITSAWAGSTTAIKTISGTSMATPHVAGVAALLLEKHDGNKAHAQNELLSAVSVGVVTDAQFGTPNELLQVSFYAGVPTLSPTRPPTLMRPTICVGDRCFDGKVSRFGPNLPTDYVIAGPLVIALSDDIYGCSSVEPEAYAGEVVLVARGLCTYYKKVKNAEEGGALAVVMYMDIPNYFVQPSYLGSGFATIPSVMVRYEDGNYLRTQETVDVRLGSPSLTPPPTAHRAPRATNPPTPQPSAPTTPEPTPRPTKSPVSARPTPAPTPRPTKSPTTPRPTKAPTPPSEDNDSGRRNRRRRRRRRRGLTGAEEEDQSLLERFARFVKLRN